MTNAGTIEVLRDVCVKEEITSAGHSLLEHYNILTTTLDGVGLGRDRSFGTPPDRFSDYAAASPCHAYNLHEMITEPVLLAKTRGQGRYVRYSNELLGIEQSDAGMRARVVTGLHRANVAWSQTNEDGNV